jgi:hypothetical protein
MKERVIKDVPIVFKNVAEQFAVSFNGGSATTEVTLQGAENVIKNIKVEDLEVIVDLSQIEEAGEYTMPIQVKGKNHLVTYVLKNAETTIQAVRK